LALSRIYRDRGDLCSAGVNVYDKWCSWEYLRKGQLHVEQFVKIALLIKPKVGDCERSTREYQRGLLSEDL
jgi:hypothetical protein